MAVGLGCSVSYTVDFFAGNIIARMAELDKGPNKGIPLFFLFGSLVTIFSLITAIIVVALDKKVRNDDWNK